MGQSTIRRTNQLKIMISDDEKATLEAIAREWGLTSSDIVRLFIRKAGEDRALVRRITG